MAKIDMTNVPTEYKSETGRYKPGHDARHVSDILGALKAEAKENNKDGKIRITAMREAQKALPTPALREKLARSVERFNTPAEKKPRAPRAAKPEAEVVEAPAEVEEEHSVPVDDAAIVRVEETQDVKVGRWFYPARRAFLEDGTEQVQRNEARDGSGAWVVA